jgi:hypothetical protein
MTVVFWYELQIFAYIRVGGQIKVFLRLEGGNLSSRETWSGLSSLLNPPPHNIIMTALDEGSEAHILLWSHA